MKFKTVFNTQQLPIILAIITGLVVAIALILQLGPGADNSTINTSTNNQPANKEQSPTPSVTDPGNQQTAPTAATTITIGATGFTPASITVAKGTTLTWHNNDTVAHAVDTPNGAAGPHSPHLAPNASFSYSFQKAGTYNYTDPTNPSRTGTVTVKEVE